MKISVKSIHDYVNNVVRRECALFISETFFPRNIHNTTPYSRDTIESLLTESDHLCFDKKFSLNYNKLVSDYCRIAKATSQIYNFYAVVYFLSACREIIVKQKPVYNEYGFLDNEAAVKFVEKSAFHAAQFKSPTQLIKISKNAEKNAVSPTTFLKMLVGGKKKRYARGIYAWDSKLEKNLTRAIVGWETEGLIEGFSYDAESLGGYRCFTIGGGDYKKHCLLMPGSSAIDLEHLLSNNIISLKKTSVTLVEKNRKEAKALLKNLKYPVREFRDDDEDPGIKLFIGDFKDLPVMKCDLAWFDMMGNLTREQALWLQNMLFSSYEEAENSNLWFTFGLVPRSGGFLKEAREAFPDADKRRLLRQIDWGSTSLSAAAKRNILLFSFILRQIFKHYNFKIDVYPYRDSATAMALIHLSFLDLRMVARPNRLF